jgi:hypothetical protein
MIFLERVFLKSFNAFERREVGSLSIYFSPNRVNFGVLSVKLSLLNIDVQQLVYCE